ncbi:MAG: hypothetical protein ACR2M4_01115 [Actinomycetota bacterium]
MEAGELGNELHLHGRGEMGERGKHFGLVRGEGVQQVAEDELQRVVPRRGAAEEVQRGGDVAAAPETERAGHPADEKGVAAGLLVEGATVGVGGLTQPREGAAKLGKEGAGGLPVEPDDHGAGIRAAAAGDDGAGTAREAVNPTSATRLRFSKDQIFGIVNSLIIRMGFFG